jgi:hypothetical protein
VEEYAPHLAIAVGVGDADELIDLSLGVKEPLQEDLLERRR